MCPQKFGGVCRPPEQGLPELTLLVPRPSLSSSSKNSNTKLDPEDVDSYYCLTLPASPHDTIRDIKQTVSESPEGFWIGAHSFQRVLLKEIPAKTEGEDPNFVFDGTPSEILSENIDIAHVFEDGMYEDLQVRRVLRLAESTSYRCLLKRAACFYARNWSQKHNADVCITLRSILHGRRGPNAHPPATRRLPRLSARTSEQEAVPASTVRSERARPPGRADGLSLQSRQPPRRGWPSQFWRSRRSRS